MSKQKKIKKDNRIVEYGQVIRKGDNTSTICFFLGLTLGILIGIIIGEIIIAMAWIGTLL